LLWSRFANICGDDAITWLENLSHGYPAVQLFLTRRSLSQTPPRPRCAFHGCAASGDIVVAYEQRIINKTDSFISAANCSIVNVPVRSRNSDHRNNTPPSTKSLHLLLYICRRRRASPHPRFQSRNPQEFDGTVEALLAELAKTKLEGIVGTSVTTNGTQRCKDSCRRPLGGNEAEECWVCFCVVEAGRRGEPGVV
jgi:hypothetical protein